jgi:indolepyruvate ferredoxin oxidoreductase
MAYKDEYEVARLYTDGEFAAKLGEQFEGDYRISFNLAPPLLSRRDKATGHLRKSEYGAWMMPVFRLLAALKGLRNTPFDPFGRTSERRQERQLIEDYEALLRARLAILQAAQLPVLAKLATIPETIRGYGHVKHANIVKAAEERQRLILQLDNERYANAAE